MAGLLDLLAHASLDGRASGVVAVGSELGGSISGSPQPHVPDEKPQSDLPSTLERLHQLVKLLAGKQLLLLLDYDGCQGIMTNPSRDMAKMLQLYPTAMVQRNPSATQPELAADLSSSKLFADNVVGAAVGAVTDTDRLGTISGVQVVSYGRPGPGA